MLRKALLLVALLFASATTGFLCAYQTRSPSQPQGIAATDWVPLSDNAGVLLAKDRKPLGPPGALHGTLYVRVENAWHRLYFEPAPISIQPAR
jgi:hypothetical protein